MKAGEKAEWSVSLPPPPLQAPAFFCFSLLVLTEHRPHIREDSGVQT